MKIFKLTNLHAAAMAALLFVSAAAIAQPAATGDKPKGDGVKADKPKGEGDRPDKVKGDGVRPDKGEKVGILDNTVKPGEKEKGGRKVPKGLVEELERINGKPLTEDQIKAVQAAYDKNLAARKALELQLRTDSAQALGLTLEQFDAKDKETRPAKGDKEGGPKKEGGDGPKKEGAKPDAPK